MTTQKFTKEVAKEVAKLQQKGTIFSVTLQTEPGIYTFKNCPNVVIWGLERVVTGSKNPKVEVKFNFCKAFEVKEGREYYSEAFSRHLRDITKTNPKNKEVEGAHRSGPVRKNEYDTRDVWTTKEVADEFAGKAKKQSK